MPENASNSSELISNENVARILALLRTGDEKIGSTRVDNAILIVGKSGSGKTTLTNFLAGNNEDLISEELGRDTGEFIIRDKNNKISSGNSTIISKTIFPEVIYDRETKTVYIDCPGFNDRGRNEAYDIAAAYFIKKTLENVKNIKIVLTANYPSLQSGVSRDDFPHLLERVTTLIKNIDRYDDSIALIATKVHNSYTSRKVQGRVELVLVPDKLVIGNIAQFLLQVKESLNNMQASEPILKSNSTLSHDVAFFDNSRKLLDALLQKKGTEYTKLGLFRRPNFAGPLSEIELLQDGKKILKRMLENNLSYAPVNLASIGYAVSDISKNIIRDLVEEINKSIVHDMSQIKDMLIDLFKRLENGFYDDDIYVLKEHLEAWSITLADIFAIRESANANELVSLMEKKFPESCKRACQPILDDIKKLGKFVRFLQDVNDKQFDSFAWKWVGELREARAYVESSLKWYNFLIALYDRLSDYDVQKDPKRFHVPKLNSASGQLENFADFFKFFNEISNSRILDAEYLKELRKVTIDDTKARYFNQVIESTLLIRPLDFTSSLSPVRRLEIIGEYVKISEVIQHSAYPESKSVQILATHTVFIDADMTKENDISIIAPRWVIIGSRVINLNGSPGGDWYPDKASSCGWNGCNDTNGSPGKPGRSAGLFFGLGDEFENAAQLQIQAIGGAGGMGQRGGDGAGGASGSTYNFYRELEKESYFHSPSGQTGYAKGKFELGDSGLSTCYVEMRIDGTPGGRGGDAGRGGAPGLGGFAGNITLIGVGNEKPAILQKIAKGNDGGFGLHGTCGEGGKGGYDRYSYVVYRSDIKEKFWYRNDGQKPDGVKGTCLYYSSVENSNLAGRADPAKIDFLYSPSSVISDMRQKLVKNFDNCMRKGRSIKFYRMLQKEDILKYDNVKLIISEFALPEQYLDKFQPDLRIQLYESVLQRIKKISKQSNDSSKSESNELLEFLSLSAISKLTRLEKNPYSKLMYNRRGYSELLQTTNLKEIESSSFHRIKKDIECTENLTEIATRDIYNVIERCIYKISSFSSNDSTLDEMERQLLKLKSFSKFRMLNEFLAFVTSLAKVDLHHIEAMSIVNTLPTVKVHLPAIDGTYVKAMLKTIEKAFEKEVYAIEYAISNEVRSLLSLGDEFYMTVDQLQDVVINLKSRWSFVDRLSQYSTFSKFSNEMKTINKINSALLKKFSPKVNETVGRFEKDMKIIHWNADLFDASTMEEFDRSSLTSSIYNIRDEGIRIDDIALEIIHSLFAVLSFVKFGLTGSLLTVESENFEILRKMTSLALGTIKGKFHELIAQIEIDEDLQTTTQNFDAVLNQLSTMFNEALPGQHQRAFLNDLHIELEKKKQSTQVFPRELADWISVDVLLYEYEHFIEVSKMSIFPFDVLSNYTLPLPYIPPTLNRSSDEYRRIIASNIKQIEAELESWEHRIKNVTMAEEFNSGNENGAFFVWRNDLYKESISKLLRGKAVVLKASLDVGDRRQWLKFDNIKLRFTSSNSTVQQSLDRNLKYFNVSLTHMGDSYFSLCNRVQLVNQDATRFIHNFNESISRVVDPINSSLKPVLSPFATWMLQLHPIDEDMNFSIQNPYSKLAISIELEGNATFVDSVNRTTCQKIVVRDFDIHQLPPRLENDQEVAKNVSGADQSHSASLANSSVAHQLDSSLEISSAYPNTLERKKRDIGSSSSVPDNGGFNWWNPFNYFSSVKPNPKFELPSKTLFLGPDKKHSPNIDHSPSLNINGALALIDFIVRNITKIKPYQSMEKSTSVEEARVIALNIIEELENMLSQLPEEKRISMSDWQEKDPVELVGQLEQNILAGDLSSVKKILFDVVPLVIPDDELDSLLGRHLSSAEIRGNFENHRSTVPDGRGHLSGAMNIDFTDQDGIASANYSFNQTALE